MKKTLALTIAFLLTITVGTFAQKFGYCNSAALLVEIPEVKAADSELQAYQGQLTKKGQEMVKDLQDQAAALDANQKKGTISPKDYETQAAKLKEQEAEIGRYEQKVYADLSKRREDLYKPILEKVNKALQDVATENGFLLVFDASTQVLLYADESLDVTKMVRVKLGLPPTPPPAPKN